MIPRMHRAAAAFGFLMALALPIASGAPDAKPASKPAPAAKPDAPPAKGAPAPVAFEDPAPDFRWPEAVIFLGDDCSFYDNHGRLFFRINDSRAYLEFDIPVPSLMGRKLYVLRPARPDATPAMLLDAGRGCLGSPCVSFDGKRIYIAMSAAGEKFFHIYSLAADGGAPRRLTDGPFHDLDPAELPDGRIVFSSTRIGSYEEYHNPPSRALFVMAPDGSEIRPITFTPLFDNDPEVLADGRIAFVRTDNFFDRAKVETQIHAIRPDGTAGVTEIGADVGPEYGGRLRAHGFGSPAPLPDGRLASLSNRGLLIAAPGSRSQSGVRLRAPLSDVAPLPDGRLLCTVQSARPAGGKSKGRIPNTLGILDPGTGGMVRLFGPREETLHSPAYLGARPRPPVIPDAAGRKGVDDLGQTGFLFCQDIFNTRNTTADWRQVRAIRVLAGVPLTNRSSHADIVHTGIVVEELGTVPLTPDGSFFIEVPADRPISFQAVDAEGRSELNEMSWIYVRPGERRSCVGCHQPRQAAPAIGAGVPRAMGARPARLLGQGRPHRFRGNNAAVSGLMDLQFERFREVASVDLYTDAAQAPGGSKGGAAGGRGAETAALAAQLRGPDASLKISAAQRLAIFRDRSAAPALAPALRDASREVRLAAALALAACGGRESVPTLLAALDDGDTWVAQAAHVALENLVGRAEPFDAFAPAVERQRGAEAWRAFFRDRPWPAIEADLIRRLEDASSPAAHRRAAVALGHVGADAARDALRRYVEAEKGKNPYSAIRYRIDGFTFNAASPLNPRTLQEAVRALGALRDAKAVGLLEAILIANGCASLDAKKRVAGNLFFAEAAAEALGRIGTPEAESALLKAYGQLGSYHQYCGWYGDHDALWACHASPIHHRIAEALDAIGSARTAEIVPALLRAVPTDPDRILLFENDACEIVTARVVRRSGRLDAAIQTCLAVLGDKDASSAPELKLAVTEAPAAWAGRPNPEIRAAQILSMLCRDPRHEPPLRAAFERYRASTVTGVPRGIGNPKALPTRNWVCFFLARALGKLGAAASVDALRAALDQDPPEGRAGRPEPDQLQVLYLHNDWMPCHRAASADALGRIGDKKAVPALLKAAGDLENALDTRHAAAAALGRIADPASADAMRKLASESPEYTTRRALLEACARASAMAAGIGGR
jgi:HEAT repeat protein